MRLPALRPSYWLAGLGLLAVLSSLLAQESATRKSKPPIVEEEEEPAKAKTVRPASSFGPISRFVEEAKKTDVPELKDLFGRFSKPRDLLLFPNGQELEVLPLARRFDPSGERGVSYQVEGADGQIASRFVTRDGIRSVLHYEARAILEASRLPAGMEAGRRDKLLKGAETLLAEVLRLHLSWRERKVRQGDEWSAVERDIRQALLNVRISQLKDLVEKKAWKSADALAGQLFHEHYTSRPLQDVIDNLYGIQAREALEQKDFAKARELAETLERDYPSEHSSAMDAVKKALQDRAKELVQQSKELSGKEQTSQALQLLGEAERIWPRLAGLRDLRLQLQKVYPVLNVGVRSLPGQLSPCVHQTDVERIASRLLFERLVALRAAPSASLGYDYKLGDVPVRAASDGWEFSLGRDVCWSDGRAITSADVRRSVEILADARSRSYDPLAAEILKARVDAPQRFTLMFSRAHIDPFSLMNFDVLPGYYLPAERSPQTPTWGAVPVGSGPYTLPSDSAADKSGEVRPGMKEVVFKVNPFYRRPHVVDGPQIREIRFIKYDDFAQARKDIAAGRLQVLLDLTTREADELEGTAPYQVLTPTRPSNVQAPRLDNPRVYFLAPNYHRPAFHSEDVRKAISLALDREKLLAEVFRGKSAKFHQSLNGPLPIDSWAYNPDVPPTAFLPDLARGYLERAKKQVSTIPNLSIKHPAEDPQAAAACSQIRSMLEAVGLHVAVEAVPEIALAQELAKEQPDFDLVYWHYDFENETLSLWPLFDPSGVGGRGQNFSGYRGDGELEGMLRDIQFRLELPYVQQQMRKVHKHFAEKAIFIPLWQLDRHVAVHRSVKFTRLHPLWVFHDIERWRLERLD